MWDEELHENDTTNNEGAEGSPEDELEDDLAIDDADFDNDLDVEPSNEDLE